MLREVVEAVILAFDECEIIIEVICPAKLSPLNLAPILASVSRSHRLLVIEEGLGTAGFGAEVIARLIESAPAVCQRVKRLSSLDHPIPACAPLERAMLPHAASVLTAIRGLMADD